VKDRNGPFRWPAAAPRGILGLVIYIYACGGFSLVKFQDMGPWLKQATRRRTFPADGLGCWALIKLRSREGWPVESQLQPCSVRTSRVITFTARRIAVSGLTASSTASDSGDGNDPSSAMRLRPLWSILSIHCLFGKVFLYSGNTRGVSSCFVRHTRRFGSRRQNHFFVP
jgi:hypothetical protein